MPFKRKKPVFDPTLLKKGQLLLVRVPPFYDKEYIYEITSAGDKLVRADLYHSPTVKKQWSLSDFALLFNSEAIRFALDKDLAKYEKIRAPEQDSREETDI